MLFVFLIGYGSEEIPLAYRMHRRLVKPWGEGEILDALSEVLESDHKTTSQPVPLNLSNRLSRNAMITGKGCHASNILQL